MESSVPYSVVMIALGSHWCSVPEKTKLSGRDGRYWGACSFLVQRAMPERKPPSAPCSCGNLRIS